MYHICVCFRCRFSPLLLLLLLLLWLQRQVLRQGLGRAQGGAARQHPQRGDGAAADHGPGVGRDGDGDRRDAVHDPRRGIE